MKKSNINQKFHENAFLVLIDIEYVCTCICICVGDCACVGMHVVAYRCFYVYISKYVNIYTDRNMDIYAYIHDYEADIY